MVAVNTKSTIGVAQGKRLGHKLAIVLLFVNSAFWLRLPRADDYGTALLLPSEEAQRIPKESPSKATHSSQCPVTSIVLLSKEEREPKAGTRHMVDPPMGGKLTLVCCETTKGDFSALLHHAWAPIGVARLVGMIKSLYFSSKIPLFRCTDACQFGLSGDPEETKTFNARLQDDPMWLPSGKDFRKNARGVHRYPPGMWTYAGAGPNTRSNQFVITLKPNPFMGGGSPWEVPLWRICWQ